jgi:ABC-type phosphate transport system substrate-binding protein
VKDKRSILRRGILAGAMVFAGCGATLAVAAAPAGASNTEMTAVGSFTTYFMMHALFPEVNMINPNAEAGSETQSISSDSSTCSGGVTYSTSDQPPNGSGQGKTALAAEQTAAADEQGCIDFSRSSSPPAPHAETLTSGGTESGDPTGSDFDYYAYALDGVAPLVGEDAPHTAWESGSDTGAGNGLTLAQIQAIYQCKDTNWDQITVNGVTGANDPIVLFWPQSGSGTRAVYTDVLGFDPTVQASPSDCTSTTQPITGFTLGSATTPNEENTEDGIIYENSVGDPNAAGGAVAAGSVTDAAIYIYSAGKFSSEWNDTTDYNSTQSNLVDSNLNGGSSNTMGNFEAGSLNMATVQNTSGSGDAYVDLAGQTGKFNQDTNRGTEAIDPVTVSETNEWYSNLPSTTGGDPSDSNASIPGIRFVYNVADTALPGYNGAKMLIGFDNQSGGARSVLCNGDMASTITAQGFLPLDFGSTAPAGSDAAGSACREFAGLSFPGQGTPIHWTTPTFDSRSS